MTDIDSVVQVGAAAGQAAIDAAADYPTEEAAQSTVIAVLQVLALQADELPSTSATDQQLLTAYRLWLKAAIAYFTQAGPVRDYAIAAAVLTAEISLTTQPVVATAEASSAIPAGNSQQ